MGAMAKGQKGAGRADNEITIELILTTRSGMMHRGCLHGYWVLVRDVEEKKERVSRMEETTKKTGKEQGMNVTPY